MVGIPGSIDDYVADNSLDEPLGDEEHQGLIVDVATNFPQVVMDIGDHFFRYEVSFLKRRKLYRSDVVFVNSHVVVIVEGKIIHVDPEKAKRHFRITNRAQNAATEQAIRGMEFYRARFGVQPLLWIAYRNAGENTTGYLKI